MLQQQTRATNHLRHKQKHIWQRQKAPILKNKIGLCIWRIFCICITPFCFSALQTLINCSHVWTRIQLINIHYFEKINICHLRQRIPALFLRGRLITGNAEELQSLPLSLIETIQSTVSSGQVSWQQFHICGCHPTHNGIKPLVYSLLSLPPHLPPNRNMLDWQENSCAVITAGKLGDSASTERSHPRLTWWCQPCLVLQTWSQLQTTPLVHWFLLLEPCLIET